MRLEVFGRGVSSHQGILFAIPPDFKSNWDFVFSLVHELDYWQPAIEWSFRGRLPIVCMSFSRRSSWSFDYRSTHTPPKQLTVFGVRDLSPVGSPRRGTTFYDERLTRHVPLSCYTLFEVQSNAWFMQRALEVNEPISFVQEHAREGDGCGGPEEKVWLFSSYYNRIDESRQVRDPRLFWVDFGRIWLIPQKFCLRTQSKHHQISVSVRARFLGCVKARMAFVGSEFLPLVGLPRSQKDRN